MSDVPFSNGPALYAPALIRLLQGPVFTDDRAAWDLVLRYEQPIRAYFAQMGVRLYCDEANGFAYLTQPDAEDGDPESSLPRLTRRYSLTYSITLLLVLLREQMNQFDSIVADNSRLIIAHADLIEMMRPFYAVGEDERAMIRKMEQDITSVVGFGFLKKQDISGQASYLVRPILKAYLNADELQQLKAQLDQHAHDESA